MTSPGTTTPTRSDASSTRSSLRTPPSRFPSPSERPPLAALSAAGLVEGYRSGQWTPVEALDELLAWIEVADRAIGAFTVLVPERARRRAEASARRHRSGRASGPLDGVPVAIKDLYDFHPDLPLTFGALPAGRFRPAASSLAVERLEAAGAVIVGRTNSSPFGSSALTDNDLFGPTRNPWCPGDNAGGSSGGSAAAVAAGMVPLALGSDGAGSIRVPAAFCGVYGFKPTVGRVPSVRRPNGFGGHRLYASSGPLARTVGDLLALTAAITGPDRRDPYGCPLAPVDGSGTLLTGPAPRLAATVDLGRFPVAADVVDRFEEALGRLAGAGASVRTGSVPAGHPSHTRITGITRRAMGHQLAQTGAMLAAAGIDDPFGAELAIRDLVAGAAASPAEQRTADEVDRTVLLDELDALLDGVDALLMPVTGVLKVANATGGARLAGPTSVAGRPVDPGIGWCLTHPMNLTGHPVAAVPMTPDLLGSRFGIQVIGRRFDDSGVLRVARWIESAVGAPTLAGRWTPPTPIDRRRS